MKPQTNKGKCDKDGIIDEPRQALRVVACAELDKVSKPLEELTKVVGRISKQIERVLSGAEKMIKDVPSSADWEHVEKVHQEIKKKISPIQKMIERLEIFREVEKDFLAEEHNGSL